MCRLAAFPPGYTKESAFKLMAQYGEYNRDGVGIAYAKDGELVVKKWADSWESLEKKGVDIFAHMPHAGWTIAHVRAATHGERTPDTPTLSSRVTGPSATTGYTAGTVWPRPCSRRWDLNSLGRQTVRSGQSSSISSDPSGS
jgi:hypothetical protein